MCGRHIISNKSEALSIDCSTKKGILAVNNVKWTKIPKK